MVLCCRVAQNQHISYTMIFPFNPPVPEVFFCVLTACDYAVPSVNRSDNICFWGVWLPFDCLEGVSVIADSRCPAGWFFIWVDWLFMDMYPSNNACGKYLKRAEYYQAEGLTGQALVQLDRAVTIAPEVAEARICRAECLRRQGRLAEAEADLEVAVRKAPDNPEPCVLMAQILAAGGDTDNALRFLDRAELIDSDWYRVHLIRGDVFVAANSPKDAEKAYRRAVALATDNVEALTALALLLVDQDANCSEALLLADKALGHSPNCVDARVVKALFTLNHGRIERALAEFNRALRINPDNYRARLERGVVLLRMGRMDEAFIDFQWCVEEDPCSAKALCGLGESAWRSGRVSEAIDAFGKAIALGVVGAEIYQGRAEALALSGRREEAVEDCTRALDLEPTNPDLYVSRGVFNMELGRYDDAMQDLSQAILLDGDLVEAVIARGELRARRGDKAGATADFAVAVRLNPDDPDLISRWIRSIGDSGDPVTGLRLLEREIHRHGEHFGLMLLKADLLAEAGRQDAARECYQEIISKAPSEMEPHLRFAEFYEGCGELELALGEYDQALMLDPADPFPRLMRAALLDRMGRGSDAEEERCAAGALRRLRGR